MIVRSYRHEDAAQLIEISKEFWNSTEYSRFYDVDEESILIMANGAIHSGGLCVVAEHEDKLVGIMCVQVGPAPFNMNILAGVELCWYVSPDARRLGVGLEMQKFVESHLRSIGVSVMSMVASNNPKMGAVEKIYKKQGYTLIESHYMRGI